MGVNQNCMQVEGKEAKKAIKIHSKYSLILLSKQRVLN